MAHHNILINQARVSFLSCKILQVKGELTTVEKVDSATQSFARLDYHEECEAAVNEQINIEYNISYVYHALHAFFDR